MSINSNKPSFCHYSILVNKCSGSWNDISSVIKNMNIRVFNLMSRTNEMYHIEWHKTCACKCRLHTSVCNNKQH